MQPSALLRSFSGLLFELHTRLGVDTVVQLAPEFRLRHFDFSQLGLLLLHLRPLRHVVVSAQTTLCRAVVRVIGLTDSIAATPWKRVAEAAGHRVLTFEELSFDVVEPSRFTSIRRQVRRRPRADAVDDILFIYGEFAIYLFQFISRVRRKGFARRLRGRVLRPRVANQWALRARELVNFSAASEVGRRHIDTSVATAARAVTRVYVTVRNRRPSSVDVIDYSSTFRSRFTLVDSFNRLATYLTVTIPR